MYTSLMYIYDSTPLTKSQCRQCSWND